MMRLRLLMPKRNTMTRIALWAMGIAVLVQLGVLWIEHNRTNDILQGKINIDQAEINANGVTIAEAEKQLNAILHGDRTDITALQNEVSALQAEDAALQQQIDDLRAQGQPGSPLSVTPPNPRPQTSTPSVPPGGQNSPNCHHCASSAPLASPRHFRPVPQ